MGGEGVSAHEMLCARDYSGTCPQGWADLGNGLNCQVPLGYTGACASVMSFGGLTPAQKSSLAVTCDADFPCIGASMPDMAASCPDGWALDAAGFCEAPFGYAGPCVGRKRFHGLTNSEKTAWAVRCGVMWPERA